MNCAMVLRRSSNPKLMLGNESAIDGASAEASGGRMPLVESDGSNEEVIVSENSIVSVGCWVLNGTS